jgi:hypothetical protein
MWHLLKQTANLASISFLEIHVFLSSFSFALLYCFVVSDLFNFWQYIWDTDRFILSAWHELFQNVQSKILRQ